MPIKYLVNHRIVIHKYESFNYDCKYDIYPNDFWRYYSYIPLLLIVMK